MKGIFLLSHMRTGSTWLMEMLATFFKDGTAGQLGTKYQNINHPKVIETLNQNIIVKAHIWNQYDAIRLLPEYTVVSIVRNPLDRFTSLFYRFRRTKAFSYNKTLKLCFPDQRDSQFDRMTPGYSTRRRLQNTSIPGYIWTTYEWLLENPKRELTYILDYLTYSGDLTNRPKNREIKLAVERGTKQTKTSKNFRKGIVGDWQHLIQEKELEWLMPMYEKYMDIMNGEDR